MERVYRSIGQSFFVLSAVAALLVACNDEPLTAVSEGGESLEPAFAAMGGRGRIAFASNRSGNDEIYVMSADGTGVVKVSQSGDLSSKQHPVLSPDGDWIYYSSDRLYAGNFGLYAIAADGSTARYITTTDGDDFSPVISPDGTRIAFASDHTGDVEIWVGNTGYNAGNSTLTNSPGEDIPGSWGNAGIYFESSRSGDREIYRMNPDGTGITRLTTSAGDDARPRIAPRGRHILFESMRDGNLEVYVMNADGTNPVRLTNSAGKDFMASWSANGKKVVFVSDRGDGEHLWIMNPDGTGLAQLTNDTGSDSSPSYQR